MSKFPTHWEKVEHLQMKSITVTTVKNGMYNPADRKYQSCKRSKFSLGSLT